MINGRKTIADSFPNGCGPESKDFDVPTLVEKIKELEKEYTKLKAAYEETLTDYKSYMFILKERDIYKRALELACMKIDENIHSTIPEYYKQDAGIK